MTAPAPFLALTEAFVECFTNPGFRHFVHFVVAHAALWGAPHRVTETLRLTGWHRVKHWTACYAFLNRGRWSCAAVSRVLLGLLLGALGVGKDEPLVFAVDDTLVKKWGRKFFGLGCYPDPTDKNPGAARRRVWGLCWLVLALLREHGPSLRRRWFCFPFAALLFVPRKACGRGWRFLTKVELAAWLLDRIGAGERKILLVVDNLYAKAALARREGVTLVSRLRSNAALHELPAPRRPGQRGAPRKRGAQTVEPAVGTPRPARVHLRQGDDDPGVGGRRDPEPHAGRGADPGRDLPAALGEKDERVLLDRRGHGSGAPAGTLRGALQDRGRVRRAQDARRPGGLPPAFTARAEAPRHALPGELQPAASLVADAARGRGNRSRAVVVAGGAAERHAASAHDGQVARNFRGFAPARANRAEFEGPASRLDLARVWPGET